MMEICIHGMTPEICEECKHQNQQIRISELEKPENAKWLALLIDTEGSLGWEAWTWRADRVNKKYRYVYHYRQPYLSVGMSERESKATIDEASKITGIKSYTAHARIDNEIVRVRAIKIDGGRSLAIMEYCLPYFVKHKRMTILCLVLFKHRPLPRREKFDNVIKQLFGSYLTASNANKILLEMTKQQFSNLIKKTEKLADTYLR